MPRTTNRYLKKEEIAALINDFLKFDKDNDCKITIKQMCKILGQDYKDLTQNNNKSLMALIGTIKIDFPNFLEFYEKHELAKVLSQAELELAGENSILR